MTTTYGVTATGFVLKDLDTIKTSLEDRWHQEFGADADVTPQSPDGQIIGILAERIFELWQLAQAVYASADPDQNSGDAQDAICAITGTLRTPASQSTVDITVCSDAGGTALASGRVFSIPGALTKFESLALATTVIATQYSTLAAAHVAAKGDRVWTNPSGSIFHVYECVVSGAITPTTPVGTGSAIVDGGATWSYVGLGKAAVAIPCVSQDYGPVQGLARTITTIETPVAGVNTAINLLDATLGALVETDSALRVKREAELRTAGNSLLDSIRAHVLEVSGVTSCTVLENTTDAVDANGLPAHSICAVVTGGDDQAIAEAVWGKAGGIATYGSTSKTVIDTVGNSHTVSFQRPTEVDIYIAYTVTYDADLWPSNGDTQIKEAAVTFGDTSKTGKDVVSSSLSAQAFQVAGVLDVTHCYIGTAPSPVSTATIAISPLQLAYFDTSRITVTSSAGTP